MKERSAVIESAVARGVSSPVPQRQSEGLLAGAGRDHSRPAGSPSLFAPRPNSNHALRVTPSPREWRGRRSFALVAAAGGGTGGTRPPRQRDEEEEPAEEHRDQQEDVGEGHHHRLLPH